MVSLIVQRFRTARLGQQFMLIGSVVALISTLLMGVYFTWFHEHYVVLFDGLRTGDAAGIVAVLDEKKIPHRIEAGGSRILVPTEMLDSTRLTVNGESAPVKGIVGFELFNHSDMGLTEFAQRINYQRAIQGELARTIMSWSEVESARVHLAMSEPTLFRADRVPPKASVTVVTRPGMLFPTSAVDGVQRLVAAAIPDMDADAVTVLDARGRVLSGGDAIQNATSPATDEREAISRFYAAKIREALLSDPDGSQAEVAVTIASEAGDPGGWNPAGPGEAARLFGLHVTIATSSTVSSESEERLRALAMTAIGGQDAKDVVGIVKRPPPSRAAMVAGAKDQPGVDEPITVAEPSGGASGWAKPIIITLAVVLLAIVIRHGRRRRSLATARRENFASQLQILLGEDLHAEH